MFKVIMQLKKPCTTNYSKSSVVSENRLMWLFSLFLQLQYKSAKAFYETM